MSLVDEDGTYTNVAGKNVTVTNVAPWLTVVGDQKVIEGQSLSVTDLAVFTDPGFDNPQGSPATTETFTYSIDWGDESTPSTGTATIDVAGQPGVLTQGSIDGSHTYAASGIYTVQVTVTDDDGASDTRSFVVYYGVPALVTAVTVTAVSNTEVGLSWVDNSSSEIGFVLEKSTDGTTFEFAGWAPADSTSGTVGDLAPSTPYWFRVSAYNDIGLLPSSVVTATTTGSRPLAPTNLRATAVGGSQVELAWTANASSEQDGFTIEQSTDGRVFTEVATVEGSDSTTATISNLSPGTWYYFRVRAYNGVDVSEKYSNVRRVTTTVDLPQAPTSLAANAASVSEITLTWTAGSTNHDGFTIERSTDGVTFILVGAATEPTYTVQNLAPDTTYYFRVQALNVAGKSAYSATASATTTASATAPAAPSYLSATAATDAATVTLTWPDNSDNESGFKIEQSTDGQNFVEVATTLPNVTTWTSDELLPATTYYFRVRAYNGVGSSAYATASVWTADVPVAPTVATDAAVSLNAAQTEASLSTLGDDEEGEANLTYTWAATMLPPGATAPEFSASGTNAAKNTTATFNAAGTYWFTVTITDLDGLSTTSSIMVTVDAIPQSVAIDPASVSLDAGATQEFTATALDQFGDALVMPMLTWSATAGTIDHTGVYTAPAISTTDTVTVQIGDASATCAVTVTNHAPTVATAATAVQIPASATASLSVLGADDAGEAGLTYSWVVLVMPGGATATFDETNGTYAGKDITLTVDTLGTYQLLVTIGDAGGLTVDSTVELIVTQTLTTITVTPAAPSIEVGQSEQFSAVGYDQFGDPMATQPTFDWSTSAGFISDDGLYTAPRAIMPGTVTATSGGVTGTSTLSITNASPTTSCRLGDGYLQAYWEESLGSPETRQARIDQAAGNTTLALSTLGPGAGYVIDPTVAFVLANPENLSQTLGEDPAATSSQWETGGIAFAATEDTEWTLIVGATVDEFGAWTYSETYTSLYTVTTTADGELFSSVSGSYGYTFTASGDAGGSTYTYTVTVNAPVTSPTEQGEWSQATSTTDTVTNTTNNANNTRSGNRSGRGDVTWSYPGSGSGDDGCNRDGGLSFTYSVDYLWSSTTGWTTGCESSNTISDGGSFSDSSQESYSESGVGWSCSGTVNSDSNVTWFFSYTTNYVLLPDGVWEMVGGNGIYTANGFSQESYTENGSYYDTTAGTYEANGHDGTTYNYYMNDTYQDGQWVRSGGGNVTDDGHSFFSYEGSGSFGQGTQNEDGYENKTYYKTTDYQIVDGSWQVVSGGSDSTTDMSKHWDSSVSSTTDSTTTTDTSEKHVIAHYEEHHDVDTETGLWRMTSMIANGDGGESYVHTVNGPYTASGEGWSVSGDVQQESGRGASVEYDVSGSIVDDAWSCGGSGSVTQDSYSSFTYSETGQRDGGTLNRSGHDEANFVHTDYYDMDSGGHWYLSDMYHDYATLGYGSADWSVSVTTTEENGDTSTEGQGTYSSYDYGTSDRYENGGWTYSGHTSQSAGKFTSSSYSRSSEYSREVPGGTISGTTEAHGESYFHEGYTTSATRNADGTWGPTEVTDTSFGREIEHSSYSGSGSYQRTSGAPCQINGTFEEGGSNNYSMSYSGSRGSSLRTTTARYSYSGDGSSDFTVDNSAENSIDIAIYHREASESGSHDSVTIHAEELVVSGENRQAVSESNFSNSITDASFSYDGTRTTSLSWSYPWEPREEEGTRQEHVEHYTSQDSGGLSGGGEATVDDSSHSVWWETENFDNSIHAEDSWTMESGSPNTVQGHYRWISSGWIAEENSYGEDDELEITGPGFYSPACYEQAYGGWLRGIGTPPMSGPATGYIASSASSDFSIDAADDTASLAMTAGELPTAMSLAAGSTRPQLEMVSSTTFLGASATPSSLLESAEVDGPSFVSSVASFSDVTFDAGGRLASISDRNGGITCFSYDVVGNLASLTDPVYNTTRWSYDDQNRLTEETNASGDTRYYSYNTEGDLARYVDRNGGVRVYQYDSAHRVVSETWYASVTDADAAQNAQNVIEYAYDAVGRLVSESDNSSAYTYAYDDLGRLVSVTTTSNGGPTVVLTAVYEGTSPQGTSLIATIDGVTDFVDDYTYDSLGRVTSVARHGATGGHAVADLRADFTYNSAGQVQSIERYQGGQLVVTSDYTYDSLGRLTGLTHHQGETVLNSYAWTYSTDSDGIPLSGSSVTTSGGILALPGQPMLPVHDTEGFTSALMVASYAGLGMLATMESVDGAVQYSYDAMGQLTGAVYSDGILPNESYTYDANGNRTGAGYQTGTDNRLLSDSTYAYAYDAEGNRIARFIDTNHDGSLNTGDTDVTEYTWDGRNRLVRVTDRATADGLATQVVDYLYDTENRWIGKAIDNDGDGDIDHQTRFVYNGNQIVLQFDKDTGGDLTVSDLSHRYLWQPDAVDQLLADEQLSPLSSAEGYDRSAPSDVVWALGDHLGTVRDLAVYDSQSGVTSVANHRVYDSFGNLKSQTDAAIDCLFGFTGRAYDNAAGLQNNLNRWYDAETGGWMSQDPIGFHGLDVNLYRYCANSPTSSMDPAGTAEGETRIQVRVGIRVPIVVTDVAVYMAADNDRAEEVGKLLVAVIKAFKIRFPKFKNIELWGEAALPGAHHMRDNIVLRVDVTAKAIVYYQTRTVKWNSWSRTWEPTSDWSQVQKDSFQKIWEFYPMSEDNAVIDVSTAKGVEELKNYIESCTQRVKGFENQYKNEFFLRHPGWMPAQ